MTNFDCMKAMSVDVLAKWLDAYGQFDGSPWLDWFNKNYCSKCESITVKRNKAEEKLSFLSFAADVDCAWCELNKKCKYFKELEAVPDNEEIIKMWLNSEVASGKDV